MKKIILPILFSFVFLFLFPVGVGAFYEIVGIDETFDNNLSNWREVSDPQAPNCPNSWKIEDGKLKAIIPFPCTTNLLPIDSVWNDFGEEYIIEMDVWFVSGIDHNIMLRYEESAVKSRFTEFHFAVRGTNPVPTRIYLDGVRYGSLQNFYYVTPNKLDPYHVRVVMEIGHIELYIDNVLVAEHNFPPELDNYDESAIFGLRAGSGIGSSETHFDNVKVYRTIDEIDVPYFSQLDEEWKNENYDSISGDIGYWGCALTSAAMLLKSHGLNYLPDSTPLNPLTLNNWLVEKGAYGDDGGVVFSTIADLSKDIVDNLPSGEVVDFDALESFRQDGLEINYETIDASLSSELLPVIFKEKVFNSPSKFHFDVATGVIESGEKYIVKDPLDENREIFEQPPDSLLSAIFFDPSNTNLSYITFQVDEEITINVESPSGKMATQNVNEIPMSHYTLELPIGNYLYPEMSSGDPFWEFEYKYPETGEYKTKLSSTEDGWFDLYSFIIDKEGGDNYKKRSVFISKDLPSTYHFDYNQDSIDDFTFARHVDKASIISDIDALHRMGLIKRKGMARYLKRMTILYDRFSQWNPRVSRKFSRKIIWMINRYSPKFIDESAKQLLLDDFNIYFQSI